MTNVLVTGGIGLVGKAVVARLIETGCHVRILDRKEEGEVRAAEGAEAYAQADYVQGDINNYPDLLEKIRGCEQIVHLAALPAPQLAPPQEIYHVNTGGTFNVFRAAEELGIRRVVQASSINAIGMYYGVKQAEPEYFPIDEDHPSYATDAYSFSKWVVEEIGEYFWRRCGISSVALRFPGVMTQRALPYITRRREGNRDLIEKATEMTESERREWLNGYLDDFKELRAQKKMENLEFQRSVFSRESIWPDEKRFLLGARFNFWALIDERDAAQAVEKGLTADYEGAHALFVNDSVNSANIEAEQLAQLFFPDVKARKRPLKGDESLVSIDKARRLIGFEPEYSFR